MGVRRKARESALKMLFALDVNKDPVDHVIDDYWEQFEPSHEGRDFADKLVRGTVEHIEQLDRAISEVSIHWKLNRMTCVDRNLLRLAAYELFYMDEVPKRVTLNEAIEIAKKYGTEDSWAFINGVLDRLARSVPE
ncbi:MAG: transcription antitermination factor NusB [Deltaproteobacteria bacterium]|nr:MAG: transcription antitermination factor NusB [Deltaproteobacteria bacterium]